MSEVEVSFVVQNGGWREITSIRSEADGGARGDQERPKTTPRGHKRQQQNTTQKSTKRHNATQHHITQHNITQHTTTQQDRTQHNTQHNKTSGGSLTTGLPFPLCRPWSELEPSGAISPSALCGEPLPHPALEALKRPFFTSTR